MKQRLSPRMLLAGAVAFGSVAYSHDAPAAEATVQQKGKATYYAEKFQGRKTASGKTFDQKQRTAASNTLPLGSTATVRNAETGKAVEVQITDRGGKGAVDLSKSAADSIGLDKREGTAPVQVEAKASDQPTPELKAAVTNKAATQPPRPSRSGSSAATRSGGQRQGTR